MDDIETQAPAAGQLDQQAAPPEPASGSPSAVAAPQAQPSFRFSVDRLPVLTELPRFGGPQLRGALASARMVAWSWDLRTHQFALSEGSAELLGIPSESVRAPEDFWSLVHEVDRAAYRAQLDRALAERQPYVARFRLRRAEGEPLWIEDRGGVTDADMRLRAAGVLIDVSEQVRAEADRDHTRARAEDLLARQRREQQIILDSVRAMIWYKDADNRILRCNMAAAQSLGLRPENVIGRRAEELYPSDARYYRECDAEVIRTGQPKVGVIEQRRVFDGTKRWFQTDRLPYLDAEGRVAGVIVFAMDVTERKLAEDVLRENEKTQREFVANVSHEFRTPVAAIKGFAETLRRGALSDVKARRRFVRIIENHANRLQWLVEDLLTLSSLESGTDKLKPEPVRLGDFVEEYLGSVEMLARKAGVKLSARISSRLVVRADQGFLLQVLENLIGNAIKYNRRGGWVRVTATRQGDLVRVTVRDNGIGIPEGSLPRIFDRFYRVNKGAASGATGLGLHIVRKIVEAHGGRIWAESRLGRGSAFHFVIPKPSARRRGA